MTDVSVAGIAGNTSQSYTRRAVKRFFSRKLAVIGLAVLVVMAMTVIFGPMLSPYAYDDQDFAVIGSTGPMSPEHWLGSDELGRDALTRLIYGGRISLCVGLAGAILSTLVGTLIGALSGFYRGWTDTILMRFTDVVMSIPTLPMILLLSGLFRPGPVILVAIVGALIWMELRAWSEANLWCCGSASSWKPPAHWEQATCG